MARVALERHRPDSAGRRQEILMHSHYLFLALDIAGERVAEADRYRLAAAARQQSTEVNRVRRIVARAAVAVARAADEAAIRQSPTTA